jgi:hypothetical protein
MIMKKIILIIIAFTTIACGCKKYEEGPCISFRSPLKRIYGYYYLSSYTINGADSLKFFNDSMGSSFYFLHDDVYDVNDLIIDRTTNDEVYKESAIFRWSLSSSNKILKIETAWGGNANSGPFRREVLIDWEILRLKYHNLKLKTTYNNKEFIIELLESN